MTQPVHDPARLRLGKRERKIDPRTLQAGVYFLSTLPTPPVEIDLHTDVTAWGMLGNDQWGDCTFAAAGHTIQAWSEEAQGAMAVITDADVLGPYHLLSPDDRGMYCIDVLNYWRRTGVGGHRLGAYAAVRPAERQHFQASAWLFGSVYIGVGLAVEQQGQAVWNYVPGSTPGSWGGHCVGVVGYNAVGPVVVTWGERKQCTWRFIAEQCDEAYAVLGPEWFGPAGRAPSGFDLAALTADLQEIGGTDPVDPGPEPVPPPLPSGCLRALPRALRRVLGGGR